jgi:ubiquinone/menaquinone biosynthesis C-methylase UbiE
MTTDNPKSLSEQRFGQRAQRYVTSRAHASGTDLDRLVEIAQPQPNWSVLDVATGGGHTALKFAPHVGHVIATDLAVKMLEAAETFITAQGAENIAFQLADAQDLPFDDTTFDLVTCRIAPHHFGDCARFVRECARVLRDPDSVTGAPGGILLVQDHVLPEDQEAARYVDDFERLRDPSHHRAFAESEWVGMFQDAGLSVTHTEQIVKQHKFLPWAERQDCSADVIAHLAAMLQRAPEAAAAWMQPTDIGTPQATFVNHHILIAGHRGL